MSGVASRTREGLGTVTTPATVPAWLLHQARTRPHAIAHRVKELGRWREVTWAQHADRVAAVGRGLAHLGVTSGSRVLLVSGNRPEWVVCDLAVQGLGAATIAVFPSAPAAELHEILHATGPRIAVVEDEEQLDKVLEARDASVDRIFVVDPRGIPDLGHPVGSFEQLEALGSVEAVEFRSGEVDAWERAVEGLEADGIGAVAFTPGTTGLPKGALLTNANLAAAADAGASAYELRADDRIVSSLPLAEITERVLVVAQATRAASTVHFGEGADALERDVHEIEPTVIVGAPRLWSRFRDTVDDGLRDAGRTKRVAFRFATRRGGRARRGIGRLLVTRPLLRHLGLARVRVALVGGAPTPSDLIEWWDRVGIRVRELYGLTESTGVATVCRDADVGSGTVGAALPGIEISIDEGATSAPGVGEVRLRGPVVFAGYLDDVEGSTVALDEGWLRTGDIGKLDEANRLTIVDRSKDVIITSAGHAVSPRPIEHRLASSRFVSTALVIGEGRPYLGALIDLDDRSVGEWADEHRVPYATGAALRTRPEVRELISEVIDDLNRDLVDEERIERFVLLPERLQREHGLITATAKVRRDEITARHADLVEEMFR